LRVEDARRKPLITLALILARSAPRQTDPSPPSATSWYVLNRRNNGSNFRISDCHYAYHLAAPSLGIGTYGVDISINGIISAVKQGPWAEVDFAGNIGSVG
jgi:hypothetical protein